MMVLTTCKVLYLAFLHVVAHGVYLCSIIFITALCKGHHTFPSCVNVVREESRVYSQYLTTLVGIINLDFMASQEY